MTRKLTLFLVCAFEIALILFVVTWPAKADVATMRCEVSSFEPDFYKLETDFFSKKIYIRTFGRWEPICEGDRLQVTDDSAICRTSEGELAYVIDFAIRQYIDFRGTDGYTRYRCSDLK